MFDRLYVAIALTLVLFALVSGCRSEEGEETRAVDTEVTAVSPVVENETPASEESTPPTTPTVSVEPSATPTSEKQPTEQPAVSPSPTAEAAIDVADGWLHYQHDGHGYTVSFPQDWTTRRVAAESLLITNSDPDMDRGSGNILPPESVDIVIFPDVEPPLVRGQPISVGAPGYEGYAFRDDPWGYLNWDHHIRIYYSAVSTDWLIDAQFAEPVGDTNPLVPVFYDIVASIRHEPAVLSDVDFAPPPYYDREWAYRQRVIRDSERLSLSFSEYERIITNHADEDGSWEQQFEETLLVWGETYDDFHETVPPPRYEQFHTHYVQALAWNAGSTFVLWTWNELEQRRFEWMVAQVMLRTADDLLNEAFRYWPAPDRAEPTYSEANPTFTSQPAERSLKGKPLIGAFEQHVFEEFGASGSMPVLHALRTPSSEADNVAPEDHALFTLQYLAEYAGLVGGEEDAPAVP